MLGGAKALLKTARSQLPFEVESITLAGEVLSLRLRQLDKNRATDRIKQLPGFDEAQTIFIGQFAEDTLPDDLAAGDTARYTLLGQEGTLTLQPYKDVRYSELQEALGQKLVFFWRADGL